MKTRLRPLLFILALLFQVGGSFPNQPVYAAGTTRYVATTGTDSGDCSNSGSPCLTLEYAYSQTVSGDTISVAAGTYTTLSEIDITRSLTITGAGAFSTIVQAAASAGIANHRLFRASLSTVVAIEQMTLRYGVEASGGAINVAGGLLTLNSVILSENQVKNTTVAGLNGGAISINSGTLTLNNSAVISNSVTTTDTLTTRGNGGGIFVGGGTATLNNSTVSGNSALRGGGGLYANGGTLTMRYTTMTNNTSDSDNDTVGDGGGLQRNAGTVTLHSNLVVGNKKGPSMNSDCFGSLISQGYNLTGLGTGCTLAGTGDLTVAPTTVFTTVLSALADNGGSTFTHALLTNSAALNRTPYGTLGCGTTYAFDQRGSARWQGGLCDSGAYEAAATSPCYTEITGDNLPDYASSDASAVQAAATAASAGGTVKIAGYCAGVTALGGSTQTVLLTKTLTLAGGYTLTNWTTAYPLTQPTTLDALGGGRVVRATVTATLQGFTVTNGNLATAPINQGYGGGIYAASDLTLTNMTVYNNQNTSGTNTAFGGGAFVGGAANITGTTFISNFSNFESGGAEFGGVANLTGTTFINNSVVATSGTGGGAFFNNYAYLTGTTFMSNSAWAAGGAYFYLGVAATNTHFISNVATGNNGGGVIVRLDGGTFRNSRFINNQALNGFGGAVRRPSGSTGTLRIENSLFAGNSAFISGGDALHSGGGTVELVYSTLSATVRTGNEAAIAASGSTTVSITNTLFAGYGNGLNVGTGAVIAENYNLFANVRTPYLNTGGLFRSGGNSITSTTAAFYDTTNYTLTASSAAIDAAQDLGLTSDYFGSPRPQSTRPDIGYYEAPTSFTRTVQLSAANYQVNEDGGLALITTTLDAPFTEYISVTVTSTDGTASSASDYPALTRTLTFTPSTTLVTFTVPITNDLLVEGNETFTLTLSAPISANLGVTNVATVTIVDDACYATPDDGATSFASVDASALRAAVLASSPGSTVKMAGYCAGAIPQSGSRQVALITKTLTLAGGYAPTDWTVSNLLANPTTLDARGGGRVLYVTSAAVGVTLQGFTVTNGYTTSVFFVQGGGLYAASHMTLTNMTFYSNTITGTSSFYDGGGAYITGTALVSNTAFINNRAWSAGGGAYFAGVTSVTGVTFTGNTASSGGGVYVQGTTNLAGVVFTGNRASNGGGAYFVGATNVAGAAFTGNSAISGGGAFFSSSANKQLVNTLFTNNRASTAGAAIYVASGTLVQLLHTTLVSPTFPTGGTQAIYVGTGTVHLTNTLIASHTVGIGNGGGIVREWNGLYADVPTPYSGNNFTVSGSLTGTAGFVDPANGNYHITLLSAALNAGTLPNPEVAFDVDGDARPIGGGYDIGYDELPYAILTVVTAGTGSGVVTPTVGVYTYTYNSVVTLTAAANLGSTFSGWSGDGDCADGVVMLDSDKACTATFTLNTYTLTVATAGTGSGVVTPTVGTYTYTYGSVVTLTAAANLGSTFSGWSGACSGTGSCVVTLTSDESVTATFTLNTYTLTVATAGNGSGVVTPTVGVYTYTYGTVVTLTATPTGLSTFAGWSVSGATDCSGTGSCVVTLTSNVTVTATFVTNKVYLPFVGK